jgi:hypothetical protein
MKAMLMMAALIGAPAFAAAQADPAFTGTWTLNQEGGGKPWTFAMPLTLNPSGRIMEYSCHEGNRAMANMLSAARADERAGRATNAPTAAEGER